MAPIARQHTDFYKHYHMAYRWVDARTSRDISRSPWWMPGLGGGVSLAGQRSQPSQFFQSVMNALGLESDSFFVLHSACYDDNSYSMYVFGGCTSTSTTFNDLWKLDLKTRTWQRPLSTGTYPSPKACSTMVLSQGQLYLFGGWTHPSLYPLHQSWRLFNELHCYDIEQNRWSHLTPVGVAKPPSMAGHSATVHEDIIVVFGGLQKQRNHIGQFCSSNDVWCFNITTFTWYQPDIPSPKPNPRYGQSQLWLDDKHLLILGGCGGPNNLYDDVWVLSMEQPHWKWISIAVKNQDQAPHHLWCHPACKVDGYAIILGKRRLSAKPTATPHKQELEKDHQWTMIPSARHGVSRGYSSIRVVRRSPNGNSNNNINNNNSNSQPEAASRPSSELCSNSDSEMDTSGDLSVEPTNGAIGDEPPTSTFKSSVTLEIQQNAEDAQPSTSRGLPDLDGKSGPLEPKGVRPSSLERQSSVPENLGARPKIVHLESDHRRKSSLSQLPPSQLARLQAFSSGSPGTYNITSCSAGSGTNSSSPKTKQQETRQRQLDAIKRMEDRIKKLGSQEEPKVNPEPVTSTPAKCVCHRLSAHVLDLGQAVSDHEVKWLEIRSFLGRDSPEETILYSLVKARSELILFGGIHKDISSMASRSQPASSSDTVSNSLFYLVPPTTIG
ncbi:F-box only protein 42-like isoform X2 [Tigriopus californicus]|uniref:F-box only protein 42-like isoform X2 n=1 Tax=Tigriopus californicus TaxID=6832 RepID=UPI0027DA626B|nr:F-box only protein 42-like isoform X2 [Tigriopus californicus]